MNEHEFILKLQRRAHEQEKIIKDIPSPKLFSTIIVWLGNHPWRYLIPLSFFISLLLRRIFGAAFTDFTLWLFKSI